MVEQYFKTLNVNVEEELTKSETTKKYQKLYKEVDESDLPEGVMTVADTKEWFKLRIINMVHTLNDQALEEMYNELETSIFKAISDMEPLPTGEDKCFLKTDTSVVNFTTKESLENYFEFRRKNDLWVEPYVFECKAIGIEKEIGDMPALISSKIEENLRKENLPSCKEEFISAASKTEGLLLAIPVNRKTTGKTINSKYEIYPIRYTGFSDLCDRAGITGRTIKLDEKKGLINPLPNEEKAIWLTRGCSLNEEHCKILIRDEKIANMKSNRYAIIDEGEACHALETAIRDKWPDYTFSNGVISHEYLIVEYLLNDICAEESFRLALEKYGVTIDQPLKAGIRYTTSNIGNSCVTASPYVTINETVVRLGKPIAVKHENKNTVETFAAELPKLASALQEAEDIIEVLGNTDILNIAGCIQHISKSDEYKNVLPIAATKKLLEQLTIIGDTSGTAVDVYLALSELINIQNNIKQMTPTQLVKMSETIAEFMFVDFKKYDFEYEKESK